jgi:uncharacterized phage-associated protein
MLNIITLSQYIINYLRNASNEVVTPLKLQHFLYYVKVWTLIANQPLIDDEFVHGKSSPINLQVANFFTEDNYSSINNQEFINLKLTQNQQKIVNFILDNYQRFDDFRLRVMSHREKPYRETNLNQVISNESIIAYYQQQRFARNFNPFDLEHNYFYPLDADCFIIDMKPEDAEEIVRFRNYQEYLNLLEQAQKELTEFRGILVAV